MRDDIPEIKDALKGRIADLCLHLLPDGYREGRLWVAHNPWVADDARKVPALKVALTGDKGAWKDWRNGDKGDVIKLISFTKGCDTRTALDWARDYLGLRAMSREDRDKMRREAAERRQREAMAADEARLWKLKRAVQLFEEAAPFDPRSPARDHACAYLAGRGCDISTIADLNTLSFRFSGGTSWWKGATWKTGEAGRRCVSLGPVFPALHSAMRQATGVITCCHVTFLDPVLPKKAPVEPPKLMFGVASGAVIELATGGGGPFWLPEAQARPLILCEGIETGLSLAIAVPEARVWAAGSLAGLGAAPVQVPAVADVTVARDNNAGNAQAQAQLMAGVAALEAHGKPITIMASHVGDDFNDLMTGDDDG